MADESAPSDDPLTPDEAFELLSARPRRRALVVLDRTDGPMDVEDLAARLVAWNEEFDPAAAPTDRCQRTATTLHHAHLPKLADECVVCYDRDENRVELTDRADALEPYIELLEMHASD